MPDQVRHDGSQFQENKRLTLRGSLAAFSAQARGEVEMLDQRAADHRDRENTECLGHVTLTPFAPARPESGQLLQRRVVIQAPLQQDDAR